MDAQELRNLQEAYLNVYEPQELTEEQVWEEVETWVNSLLEEGYDLSEYTWEEMYESYLEEQGRRGSAAIRNQNVYTPPAQEKPQIAGGGMGGRRGSGRDRNATQTSSSPGALRVPAPTAAKIEPYKSKFAGARDAAFEKAKQIKGSPVLGPKKVGPGSAGSGGSGSGGSTPTAPRPAATPAAAPSPKTTPTAPTKPAGSAMDQFAKANPKLAAAQAEKDRIRGTSQSDNPLMKNMKDRMPMTPSVQSPTLKKDLGGGSGNQSLLNNPNASKAATPKKTPITSSFDYFDAVKGYLIDEGYADTEEAAIAIMGNMSDAWVRSIIG